MSKSGCLPFVIITLMFMAAAVFVPVYALSAAPVYAASSASLPRFIDEAGYLSDGEAAALTAKLDEISERQEFDVVIASVRDLDSRSARVYALDLFIEAGFGYGNERDGAILLIAARDRDFGFAASGFGEDAFTRYGQEYLDKLFVPYLSDGEYNRAFNAFAEACDDFVTQARYGRPYDRGSIPLTDGERFDRIKKAALVSLVIALLVTAVLNIVWVMQLKSVRRRDLAHMYIREGSMNLTSSRDMFLTRRVVKTRREHKQSGGGGGIGGSFTGSSGHSGTGHSGKF